MVPAGDALTLLSRSVSSVIVPILAVQGSRILPLLGFIRSWFSALTFPAQELSGKQLHPLCWGVAHVLVTR